MRTSTIAPILLLSAGCTGEDVDFAILASTPAALCRPQVEVHVDDSGALHWEAYNVRPPLIGAAYTLWLVDLTFAIDSCMKFGTLPVADDGTGRGSHAPGPAMTMALSRPDEMQLVVTLESDPETTLPDPRAFHVELWAPDFPRPGDRVPTPFAFGDGARQLRLEDFVSASGMLGSPTRGFARVEINYPTHRIVARLWNFKAPLAGRVFVLWATDGSIYSPLAVIREIPELKPTRPSDVNGFEPTDSELRIEIDHDPARLPWDRFHRVVMTYEAEAPNDEHALPSGVVVMRGDALSHDGVLDYGSGHGGHHGGEEEDCVLGSAAHSH